MKITIGTLFSQFSIPGQYPASEEPCLDENGDLAYPSGRDTLVTTQLASLCPPGMWSWEWKAPLIIISYKDGKPLATFLIKIGETINTDRIIEAAKRIPGFMIEYTAE